MLKWPLVALMIVCAEPSALADNAKVLDACELLQHPNLYQGRRVIARGSMVDCGANICNSRASLDVNVSNKWDICIGPINPKPGGVSMTITGKFRWQPSAKSPFSSYVLEAQSISRVAANNAAGQKP